MLIWGFFFSSPFQGCVNKPTSFCRVALWDRVIRGFHLVPPQPWASPSVTWPLRAAGCSPQTPPASPPPLLSVPSLIYPVIIIWEDPRARVSISQKAVWSFLGTWSPSQRQGHSQAQGWPGGGSGFTIADQSPPGRERTGNAPCPVPLGDLWDP